MITGRPKTAINLTEAERHQLESISHSRTLPHALVTRARIVLRSLPLFWNEDNLPVGIHFAGRFGDEATLFRLAAQLEEARPWSGKRPPVSA